MQRFIWETLNNDDKKKMTITTEWIEETIKVTILREGNVPLTGQTTVTELQKFAPADVPLEKWSITLQNELSGKDNNIQFVLRDRRLTWKKKIWKRGGVDLEPANDIVAFADISLRWLNEYSKLQEINLRQAEEEIIRRKNYEELVSKIKSLEDTKKMMEDTLFKQFVMLLNTKKAKIRELENKLKSQDRDRSIYDMDTDKSSDESSESLKITRKKSRSPKNEPTTSKNAIIYKSSQESESDEIILKLEETPENLDMEEEPEEDLFSQ